MAEFNEVVGRNIEFIEKDSSFTPQVTAASLEGHTVKASFRVSVPFSAITVVTPVKEHRLRLLGAGRRLLARPKIAEDLLLPVIEKLEVGQAGKAHDLIEQLSRSKLGRLIAVTAAGSLPDAEASQLRGMITEELFERAVVAARQLLAGATLPLRRRFWWRAVAILSFFPFLGGLVAFLFPPPGVVLTQDGETLFWLALALASTILPWVTALVAFKLKSRQWTKKLVNTDQVEAMDIGRPGVAALVLPILLFSAICYGLYEFSGTTAYTQFKALIWKAVTDLLAV